MTDPQILPADTAYRTKMIIVFAVTMLLALAIAYWGVPLYLARVEAALEAGDADLFMRYIRGLEIGLAVLFLGFIPFCIYNIRSGLRIRREERYPASGMRVLRDTTVLTGDAATRRGSLLVGMGIVLMAVSLLAAVFAVMTIEMIVHGGA